MLLPVGSGGGGPDELHSSSLARGVGWPLGPLMADSVTGSSVQAALVAAVSWEGENASIAAGKASLGNIRRPLFDTITLL